MFADNAEASLLSPRQRWKDMGNGDSPLQRQHNRFRGAEIEKSNDRLNCSGQPPLRVYRPRYHVRRYHRSSLDRSLRPSLLGNGNRRGRCRLAWVKSDPEAAAVLMKPANEDLLVSRPVGKAVGNARNDGPALLEETMVG
jgi:hypothetical protein